MRRHVLAGALILAAVFAAYSNSLRNGFVWDDHLYVLNNPFLGEPGNIRFLLDPKFYASSPWVLAGNRPVFLASLVLDRTVWGFNPAGYHLTNLLIHSANSLWVYALALLMTASWPAALLAGLLFGLHPLGTEAVNAVCFRPDLLAAFFVFAGLWVYLKTRASSASRTPLVIAACAGLFGLGLLSKEMAASLPLLVLLAEACFPLEARRRARLAWTAALCVLIVAAYAAFWAPRFQYSGLGSTPALRSAIDSYASSVHEPGSTAKPAVPKLWESRFFSRASSESERLYKDRTAWLWTMSVAFNEYFRLMIFPEPLVVDRSPGLFPMFSFRVFSSLALLGLLILYAVVLRPTHPMSSFGVAWCFMSLIPVSGILPLFNPIAERYLYMVMAGACWAVGSGIATLAESRPRWALPAAGILAALMLAAFGFRTHARNHDWESDRTLFLKAPLADQTARASFIRGNILRQEGKLAEASREYIQALRTDPGFAEAWLNLGMAHAAAGDRKAAAFCYEKAVTLLPGSPVFQFGYALFLAADKDKTAAVKRYRLSLDLDPAYTQAWVNLGALYRDSGRLKEAKSCYEKALALSPADPVPYYSYAVLLEKTGQRDKAVSLFREALAKDESFEPAKQRLVELQRKPGKKRR
ncbi:MAG: tetratricopeptide repeat protein [Elusimicrobia bacterium]|nr:tetratricopeptide repeat protein [Elusimicrobiota bacterium]